MEATNKMTWANRPNIIVLYTGKFAPRETVVPVEAYRKWVEGFGRELDAVKQLAKEATEKCEGDSINVVIVDREVFKRLVEAVQNL